MTISRKARERGPRTKLRNCGQVMNTSLCWAVATLVAMGYSRAQTDGPGALCAYSAQARSCDGRGEGSRTRQQATDPVGGSSTSGERTLGRTPAISRRRADGQAGLAARATPPSACPSCPTVDDDGGVDGCRRACGAAFKAAQKAESRPRPRLRFRQYRHQDRRNTEHNSGSASSNEAIFCAPARAVISLTAPSRWPGFSASKPNNAKRRHGDRAALVDAEMRQRRLHRSSKTCCCRTIARCRSAIAAAVRGSSYVGHEV